MQEETIEMGKRLTKEVGRGQAQVLRQFDGKTFELVDTLRTKHMAERMKANRKQHGQNVRIVPFHRKQLLYAQKGKGGVF
jgi:hypothetical protein